MSDLVAAYHEFLQGQSHEGYSFERTSDDQYALSTDSAQAQIDFWDDIVEFNVTNSKTDENVFALHFQLREDDWDHCQELFGEMVAALLDQANRRTVNVLLSCTAGMTTFMFSQQLNTAAKELSWDYSFNAVPYANIYEEGFNYDVILLAPQIAYLYDKIAEVFRDRPVIQIPTRMFAAYDTGSCLEMVRDKVIEARHTKAQRAVYKIMHGIDQDACVLSIVLAQSADMIELPWRVYDNGEVVDEGVVVKMRTRGRRDERQDSLLHQGNVTVCDFKDIVGSVVRSERFRGRIEAVGIALAGVVEDGRITLPRTPLDGKNLSAILEESFGIPTVIANNANAAALGWYAHQDRYRSVVFHSQSRGLLVGGQGIVCDGHLIEGKHGLAGEIQAFFPSLRSEAAGTVRERQGQLWDPDVLTDLLAQIFSADVGVIAPEVICVRSELTPDMGAIKAALTKYVPEERQPDLVYVPDFAEYASLGLVILALKRLRLAA